jgi:hypothetical protein
MARVELLTPELIDSGARFQPEMAMLGRNVEMTAEFTLFERPRRVSGSRFVSKP